MAEVNRKIPDHQISSSDDDDIQDTPIEKPRRISEQPWEVSESTKAYVQGYPELIDDPSKMKNLEFYMNKRKSTPSPSGTIEFILSNWRGKFELLEDHHGYIQWLFPIREQGMNYYLHPLQIHEANAIRSDPEAHGRVLRAYKLMLDFFGMQLNDVTGEVCRGNRWCERFRNLRRNTHNCRRITRIIKSLGELGWEQLQKPLVDFLITEVLSVNGGLTTLRRPCLDFWIHVIKQEKEREEIIHRATVLIKSG